MMDDAKLQLATALYLQLVEFSFTIICDSCSTRRNTPRESVSESVAMKNRYPIKIIIIADNKVTREE